MLPAKVVELEPVALEWVESKGERAVSELPKAGAAERFVSKGERATAGLPKTEVFAPTEYELKHKDLCEKKSGFTAMKRGIVGKKWVYLKQTLCLLSK